MSVRAAAVAGYFYNDNPLVLQSELDSMLEDAQQASNSNTQARRVKAMVVPHAGYVYSGPIAASAYRLLEQQRDQIKRVVLLGCLLYTSPSPRDLSTSRMPSSA